MPNSPRLQIADTPADAPEPKSAKAKLLTRPLRPGLLRREDLARYLRISIASVDRLNAAGSIPRPIKLGGSLAWGREELAAFCRYGCPPRTEWTPIWAALLKARIAKN